MNRHEKIQKIKDKTIKMKKPLMILVFLLFLDFLVFIGSFSLNHVFRPDILMIVLYLSFYAYLYLTKRSKDIPFLLIASAVAFFWLLIANSQYGYNREMISIFGLSAFPLFAWATGMAALYFVYDDLIQILFKDNKGLKSFLLYSLLYVCFIVSLETIAYHVFDIRNNATAMYVGLPVCDCIHAPRWMQASYLLIGPFYYLLCKTYIIHKEKVFNLSKNH